MGKNKFTLSESVGEHESLGRERKKIAEELAKLAVELPGVFRGMYRFNRGASSAVVSEKLKYSAGLIGTEPDEKNPLITAKRANKKVIENIKELKLLASSGRIKDADTLEATEALVEFMEKYLKKREWKALALSLDEKNMGLRISPDLARALVLNKDPEAAMRGYKKAVAEAEEAMPYAFQADVISKIENGIVTKRGPDYVVPLVESEIDWDTGKVKRKYIFYMLHYETDTALYVGGVSLRGPGIKPYEEHEPFGGVLKVEKDEKLKLTHFVGRSEWIPWRLRVKDADGKPLVEMTGKGEVKVTARPDTKSAIFGHINLPVFTDFEEGWKELMQENEELHSLLHAIPDNYLKRSLRKAPKWFEESKPQKPQERMVMGRTKAHIDALAEGLR